MKLKMKKQRKTRTRRRQELDSKQPSLVSGCQDETTADAVSCASLILNIQISSGSTPAMAAMLWTLHVTFRTSLKGYHNGTYPQKQHIAAVMYCRPKLAHSGAHTRSGVLHNAHRWFHHILGKSQYACNVT